MCGVSQRNAGRAEEVRKLGHMRSSRASARAAAMAAAALRAGVLAVVVLVMCLCTVEAQSQRYWVNELTDGGNENTETSACCIARDQGTGVVILGTTNGDIGGVSVGGTFNMFTERYSIQTGISQGSLLIPDQGFGDETAQFLIIDIAVEGGQIACFGTTDGNFFRSPINSFLNFIVVTISNDNAVEFARNQLNRNVVGDDILGGVELTNNGYLVIGSGKSNPSASTNNALILWRLNFALVEQSLNVVTKTTNSAATVFVRTTSRSVPNQNVAIAYGVELASTSVQYFVDVYSFTVAFQYTVEAQYRYAAAFPNAPIDISSVFYDSVFDAYYIAGQFPPTNGDQLSAYSGICTSEDPFQLGNTAAIFGAVSAATGSSLEPFSSYRSQRIEGSSCGTYNAQVRVGVDTNGVNRVLIGMDFFFRDAIPTGFRFLYQTSLSPTADDGQTASRLNGLPSQQNFEGISTPVVGAEGAVLFGSNNVRSPNGDLCFPEGPAFRNHTIAGFSASQSGALWVATPGTLCDDYLTDLLAINTTYGVALGVTKGSFVGGTNPLQRERVVVYSLNFANGDLPNFDFRCNTGCSSGSATPTPSPTLDPNCVFNSTHCTCRRTNFRDCVVPSISTANTCLVNRCLGIECNCFGDSVCKLERRLEWTADEPIDDQETVACSLFSTTFPTALWVPEPLGI
ncbi:hypothetical protein FVE85_3169 [Porphyridium purpureum]|uniref:Uncharacterized protein n=1 Tax=Porphyridium purpureum TaxID=35688 RepID=A0A5J4YUQ2_PORPP|nr:hypothetical protein FVE85_3169 [Porphyridium purpureum]|eukprot:POR8198..scf227_4